MFASATSFNQPIGNWNVSGVTSMSSMFSSASNFNQPLSGWNVSNVTNMSYTFSNATSFNRNINDWNVSNVQFMNNMFNNATNFNQNINNWNVTSVNSMTSMFAGAGSFNQPLSGWNVSNVQFMNNMFNNATNFNQNINNWNIGNVLDFSNFMSTKTPSTFSAANLDAIYNGWSNLTYIQNFLSISFGTANYTTSVSFESRELLRRYPTELFIYDITNNGSGLCRVFVIYPGNYLPSGSKIAIYNVQGTTEANGAWYINAGVDETYFDLIGSTFINPFIYDSEYPAIAKQGWGWTIVDGGGI